MKRGNKPEVAILLPLTIRWGRDLLQGVVDYARQHADWHFLVDSVNDPGASEIPRRWRGDGAIGRLGVRNRRQAERLKRLGCPVVNVAGHKPVRGHDRWARVATHYTRVAEVAAEHLIDCGLRQFGYVAGHLDRSEADRAFQQRVERAGGTCHNLDVLLPGQSDFADVGSAKRRLGRWLAALPKPIGLYTATDALGRLVLQSCSGQGIAVPDEVAVVACNNDPLLCDMADPPLSSVALAARQQGYAAAAMLDRLMQGKAPPSEPVLIDPVEIVPRRSSDLVAVEDPDVARAVRFIRDHATRPSLTVLDVLAKVPTSRRSLELRFVKFLGRTPAAEIRRMRFERARHLLANTNLPVNAVAASAGFYDQAYMCRVFQKRLGLTPRQFRLAITNTEPPQIE